MRVYMETGLPSITGFREHWEAWDSSVLFMENSAVPVTGSGSGRESTADASVVVLELSAVEASDISVSFDPGGWAPPVSLG